MTCEPDFSTPGGVREYLYGLGMCGCMDVSLYVGILREALEWAAATHAVTRISYDNLFGGNVGVFYFIFGALEMDDLVEHGVSIRYPYLKAHGKLLLEALRKFTIEQIDYQERNEP